MVQAATFTASNVISLWGVVIGASVAATVLGFILAHILSAVVQAAQASEEPEGQDDLEDERDKLIRLKGTRAAHAVSTFGTIMAMLTFVLNQSPLVMFSLLIATGLVAQVVGDAYQLFRYSKGA